MFAKKEIITSPAMTAKPIVLSLSVKPSVCFPLALMISNNSFIAVKFKVFVNGGGIEPPLSHITASRSFYTLSHP